MKKTTDPSRILTGVTNLDAVLGGGLPKGSVSVLSGSPGTGKTILSQQICFNNATPKARALCFSTLSEPTAKTLQHLQPFSFFDPKKLGGSIEFVDLGGMLRTQGLEGVSSLIMDHIKRVKPTLVVIDSFKVFDDLARSKEELRKFVYELIVSLMAWETTALLLGEYGPEDLMSSSLFAIVDGMIVLSQREALGEDQRFCKVVKMRGTNHSRQEHPFVIASHGLEVFATQVGIKREETLRRYPDRCKTKIPKLDEVLGPGIPWGSSLLIGGVAGTGKTVLSLEFIYRGALAGEKGILFSFEETEERLRAAAEGLGWDLGKEIDRGMVEIVFIPQPDILVEAHLLMMKTRIEAGIVLIERAGLKRQEQLAVIRAAVARCGNACRRVHEHLPARRWLDLPWAEHPVVIEYAPVRVKCRHCHTSPTELIAWAEPHQRQTRRLQQHLAVQAASMPISHVALLCS